MVSVAEMTFIGHSNSQTLTLYDRSHDFLLAISSKN